MRDNGNDTGSARRGAAGEDAMSLPVLIPLPADQVAAAWRVMRAHGHDPLTQACPVHGFAECEPFRVSWADLALAGELSWDPIGEMARRRMWLASLQDR